MITESMGRMPSSVVQMLLNSIERQDGISEVQKAGYVSGSGIWHDGIISGSDPHTYGAGVRVYLEVARYPVVDHIVAKSLLEKVARLGETSDGNIVKCLLIHPGSMTSRAQQDFARSNVIPRSFRSLADLESDFWKTIGQSYNDRGLGQIGRQLHHALEDVPLGAANSSLYEDACGRVLEFLFSPDLGPAKPQSYTLNRSQRRDFIMKNDTDSGFWARMRERYGADYLIAEVKNTKGRVGNGAVWQLAGYMKEKGVGFFGVLIARNGVTKGVANAAILDQWIHANKMIVPVSSEDLGSMIEMRDSGADPTEFIDDLIDRIRCSV